MAETLCYFSVQFRAGRTLLRIVGELCFGTVNEIRREIDRIGGRLVVDCRDLRFIDVAGLRMLLEVGQSHCGIVLRNVPPFQQRIIDLAGWTDELPIERDGLTVPTPRCASVDQPSTTLPAAR